MAADPKSYTLDQYFVPIEDEGIQDYEFAALMADTLIQLGEAKTSDRKKLIRKELNVMRKLGGETYAMMARFLDLENIEVPEGTTFAELRILYNKFMTDNTNAEGGATS